MAKRRYSISASEDETIPILACFDKASGPAKKTFLSVLACNSCKTQVLANNFAMPFCPCCASEDVTPVSEDLMEHSKQEIEEMEPVAQCGECNTVIASPKEALASLDDHALYCPSCSSLARGITAADAEDEEDDEDSEEDMNETVDDDSDGLFDNNEGEGGEDSDNQSEDTTSDNSTEESSAENKDDTNSNGESETASEDTTSTESPSLNANLVKFMSGKEGSTAVVASPDRSKWFLFVDNVPVATAAKENASDNVQGMFSTDKFVTAWEAATSDGVNEDTLADFGFTAINTAVPVDEAVKQTVEAAIEEKTKKLNLTAKEISDRYQRCIGIAAVGINKDVFREENPVKAALVASLGSMRVRNPERLVASAFNQYGEQFLKNIALKASELMEKSDETLDELADTVDAAKYDNKKEDSKADPSVVSLFPIKEEENKKEEEPANKGVQIAASDDVASKYANMLSGANLRA